jgi:heme/copper-type cytochrome/quinol oxidase subunit 3
MSEQLAVPVALQRGRPLGYWGMLMLIATEAVLFGAIVAAYFYIRFKTPHWPPPGVPEPKVLHPLLFTIVLIVSSLPAGSRRGRRGASCRGAQPGGSSRRSRWRRSMPRERWS